MSISSKNISPLEQVKSFVLYALRSVESRNKAFESFFSEVMTLVLTISGRINFLQLARFGKSCEQRFRMNFCKSVDWIGLNKTYIDIVSNPTHRTAIAIDQSYISKAGNKTPGVGRFWSGCAQAAKHGLEILGFAVVDADERDAMAIRAVQTLTDRCLVGIPDYIQEVKDSLVSNYLQSLWKYKDDLLKISDRLVADAYFSKKDFVTAVINMGFTLISRLRDDVQLKYLSNDPPTGKRGRPKMFDGKVDINNPREDVFTKEILQWDDHEVIAYSAIVYAVALGRKVKAVIVCFDDPKKKTQTRKIFFSTDVEMSAKDIVDIYRSRFQIEFLFRDAKQYMGLTHCQARNTEALDFQFNMSLSAVNVVKAYCKQYDETYSIADFKLLMHNAMMLERFKCMYGILPDIAINQGIDNKYDKELLLYGLKAAA